MWQRFTERARKVVFFAQEAAAAVGENYVGSEHLLLGLLREPDIVAGRIISRLGLDPLAMDQDLRRRVAHGDGHLGNDMQLTPRAKRVIDYAYDESRQLDNNYIGTEHLLLGLIRDVNGIAGSVLARAGADLEEARQAIRQLQAGGPAATDPSAVPPTQHQTSTRPMIANSSINRLVANALFEARELGYEQPASEHYLLALFTAEDGKAKKVLEALGLTREKVLSAIDQLEKEAIS
jgi:ATP-dependent Clp protease ATP-binding subunit ClpA